MKEQILKIIDELKVILTGEYPFNVEIDSKKKAAEEITSHIKKFIEWKDIFIDYDSSDNSYYNNTIGIWCTLGEIYQYWLTKIENHE
jgi:hypothetical protein